MWVHALCPPAALYQIQTEKCSRGNQAEIRMECEMKTFLDWQKAAEGKRERKKTKRAKKRENRINWHSGCVNESREWTKKPEKEERKIYCDAARSKGANKVLQSTQIYRLRNQWENQFGWTWLLASGNASDQGL